MKIAFYIGKHGTWYDRLICLVTRSKYSHCEIVLTDGMCASSSVRDGGVRYKIITLDDHWDVYNLSYPPSEASVITWFNLHDSNKYSYIGAVLSVFGIVWKSEHEKFCSEACGEVLGYKNHPTPEKLYQTLKRNGEIT